MSEIIKQSFVYQSFEEADSKVVDCYLKVIASLAQTYKSLCNRKTPDLDKWADKLVNSQLAKFYAQENDFSQNIEQQKTKQRGLSL